MISSPTLVIDSGPGGEQVVRPPRPTDAIGGSLRAAFAMRSKLPDEIRHLLHQIDRATTTLQ